MNVIEFASVPFAPIEMKTSNLKPWGLVLILIGLSSVAFFVVKEFKQKPKNEEPTSTYTRPR